MMAEAGAMTNVTGSKMAMPLVPPNPGRTPMTTPRKTPTEAIITLYGLKAIPNPIQRLAKLSMDICSLCELQSDVGFQESFGQGDQKPLFKKQVVAEGEKKPHQQHRSPGKMADPAHKKCQIKGGGDVKTHKLHE